MKLKKGQDVLISHGEDCDYTTHGIFRSADDFSTDALVEECRASHPYADAYGFVEWLVATGKLTDVTPDAWHLGSYDLMEMEPNPPSEPVSWSALSVYPPVTDATVSALEFGDEVILGDG